MLLCCSAVYVYPTVQQLPLPLVSACQMLSFVVCWGDTPEHDTASQFFAMFGTECHVASHSLASICFLHGMSALIIYSEMQHARMSCLHESDAMLAIYPPSFQEIT